MERIIFVDYPPGFSLDNCISLYTSFIGTSRVGSTNAPSYLSLKENHSRKHSQLQYKAPSIYSSNPIVFRTRSAKIQKFRWSLWNDTMFGLARFFLTHSVKRIIEKCFFFLILIGILLRLDHTTGWMDCTGLDYYNDFSAMLGYGLCNWFTSCLASSYPWLENILLWWPLILRPLQYIIGALGRNLQKPVT